MPLRVSQFYEGLTVGKYTLLGTPFKEGNKLLVKAKCACGTIKNVHCYNLAQGKIISCGCHKRSKSVEIAVGQVFGRLTVTEVYTVVRQHSRSTPQKLTYCNCKCACGEVKIGVLKYSLLNGKTKSCGCLQAGKRKKKYAFDPGTVFNGVTLLYLLSSSSISSADDVWCYRCSCGEVLEGSVNKIKRLDGCHCATTRFEGKRFGAATVLRVGVINGILRAYCHCDCGKNYWTRLHNYKEGISKSCGSCEYRSILRRSFGTLQVKSAFLKEGVPTASCACTCGEVFELPMSKLLSGEVKACPSRIHKVNRIKGA